MVTTKAKTKIKQVLNEEKTKAAAEGKEILMRRLKNWKIPFGDILMQRLLNSYNLKTSQDLYYLITTGKIELLDIKEVLQKEETAESITPPVAVVPEKEIKRDCRFSIFRLSGN